MRLLLILIGLFFICSSVNAQNTLPKSDTSTFNITAANKKFDEISIKLSTQNLKRNELERAVQTLETLQSEAKACVAQSQARLKTINELLKASPSTKPTADHTFLLKRKAEHEKRFSECRLFVFRSEDAITAYKDAISKMSTYHILQHNTPIWHIPQKITAASFTKINWKGVIQFSGIKVFNKTNIIIFSILVLIGLATGYYLRLLCKRGIESIKPIHYFIHSLLRSARTYIIPILVFSLTSLFLYIINGEKNPRIEQLSYTLLLFFLILGIAKFIFSIRMEFSLRKPLIHRFVITATWGLIAYIALIIFQDETVPIHFVELSRTLFITILSILVVIFCWTLTKSAALKQKTITRGFLKTVLALLLLMMLITEWLGFHKLAIYLISSIVLTLILVGVTWTLAWAIRIITRAIDDNRYKASQLLRKVLGIKPHKKINELLLLKFALYVILTCAFFIFFLRIWHVSANFIDNVTDGLIDGFNIAGLTIVPSRIIIAIVVFSIGLMFVRLIATYVARHHQFSGEKETQVAIASLILYVGFSLALLLALLAAGVNFTGLAIIAGALSVGIGLGLQNIANNFISGIILLLEKPIRPGDRVVVDDIEGFVKRIRIRSTQITTLAKEDVIVPNADLISKKVTNYMFRDQYWRVVCQVGVAYGSDINRVREVLLDIAAQHPDVVQEKQNAPLVLFKKFGNSSLVFDLWCIIHDVNKKFIVASDLNFAIDKAFHANGITIAFPQRDIHIRDHLSVPDKR